MFRYTISSRKGEGGKEGGGKEGRGRIYPHPPSPRKLTPSVPKLFVLIWSPPVHTETLRRHGVTLKSTVSTIVVTTLVLEGWSSKVRDRTIKAGSA